MLKAHRKKITRSNGLRLISRFERNMKIVAVRVVNFRGYQDSKLIRIDAITAFIGKNDAGKSTVLDALNIFFENQKIDKDDVNKGCRAEGNLNTEIEVHFSELPKEINIDAGCKTTLVDEYLLSEEKTLVIVKKYHDAGKPKVYIRAYHPTNEHCSGLLLLKQQELKKRVDKLKIDCNLTKNSVMRKAIWESYKESLNFAICDIEIDSKDGDMKAIWAKLQPLLPVYSLFRSDRINDDKDEEVQDPLKEEIRSIILEESFHRQLDEIAQYVRTKLQDVAARTLAKIQEMSPDVANTLHPRLPEPKWEDVFKGISITGDEDIPMSKRGSGVRRLILLNFFRAKAERIKEAKEAPNVIYAIEEPETSQHADFQRQLVAALIEISKISSVQVLLTTHSSHVLKALKCDAVRLVQKTDHGSALMEIYGRVLPYVSLNEVSYLAFEDEASVEYHDELYGHLWVKAESELGDDRIREKDFDRWLKGKGLLLSRKWKRENDNGPRDCTLQTYIRNKIHHPENREQENRPYTEYELKTSIAEMRNLLIQSGC